MSVADLNLKNFYRYVCIGLTLVCTSTAMNSNAAELPELLSNTDVANNNYLPDFSFAGYQHGQGNPDTKGHVIVNVEDHEIIADDGLDDSLALIKLIADLNKNSQPTVIQFNSGRYILSSIIFIDRSNLVLRGAGSGVGGTEFYFPRPLNYVPVPDELKELSEYLVELDKIERQKENNIALPFSKWAWTGGFFWTRVPGVRVKQYLSRYDKPIVTLAKGVDGKQGDMSFKVDNVNKINVGDVLTVQWFNTEGETGEFLNELYPEKVAKVGSHHWTDKELALATQPVTVTAIENNLVSIGAPLLHNIVPGRTVKVTEWKHLKKVGFEHFSIRFPYAEIVAHHVEQGFNAMYLTRVFDSWVDDVKIINADSGIITEGIANVTIKNIVTEGTKKAHYTVQMGQVHNVLVDNLHVKNLAEHPLSFNTFATRSVYHNCTVDQRPVLDQHSGVNQQNLFDNISVSIKLPEESRSYPLFAGGGAGYWKPSAGAYNTFWNIRANFQNGHDSNKSVLLNGMSDGPRARLVGVRGNLPIKIEYGPNAYIEGVNEEFSEAPSLYHYQLKKRLKGQ